MLNILLQEIMRVHGPTSVYLERLVPEGGVTLDGYFIPEGTVSCHVPSQRSSVIKQCHLQQVGGMAYSSHHDERCFPQPHVVDPLRWVRLDEETGQYVSREDVTPAMNANWFPFG